MKDLKPANRYRKVLIEQIVFLQGQDYEEFYELELSIEPYIEDIYGWEINHLLQWYYPNEGSQQDWYNAKELNTEFLGNLIKIDGYKGYFLLSVNRHIGYIGLAKVVEFSMKIID